MAQSTVTLYGLVDLGVAQSKDTATAAGASLTAKKSEMTSMINGPRIGFKGTEDLGGGLKANFLMEYGVQPDDGAASTTMNNRQSFVGVEGGFGTVNLGRQYTAYHVHQATFDMVNGNTNTLVGNVVGLTTRVRSSNTIAYTSPGFAGFSARADYGFGEAATTPGQIKTNNSYSLSAKYASGPLVVGAGYDQVKNVGTSALISYKSVTAGAVIGDLVAAGSDKFTVTSFGASYDLGMAKLAGQYFTTKTTDADTSTNDKANGYNVGVAAPLGAVTLAASLSGADLKDNGVKTGKASGYQLLATYALSKRSTVYAAAGQDKIKEVDTSNSVKRQQYGVGLRHSF